MYEKMEEDVDLPLCRTCKTSCEREEFNHSKKCQNNEPKMAQFKI